MSDQWNADEFRTTPFSAPAAGRKTVEELAKEFEDVVITRLRRVESSNSRLKKWVGLLALVNVVLAVAAAGLLLVMARGGRPAWAAQTVTARRFVLAGADGKVRGAWGTDRDGAARWALSDSSGTERLRFSVLPEGGSPGLAMTDDAGNTRVALAFLPDETSTLVFADRAGFARAVLGMSGQATTLAFADQSGNTKAGLGIDALGQPDLLMDEGDDSPVMPEDTTAADSTGQ